MDKNVKTMGLRELEAYVRRLTEELYSARMELSRRTGDLPSGGDEIDFEKYVTK